MSLRLQIKKKMLERSPRVKAIDFHPSNTWVVFGLYSGVLALHDYSTNTCIRTLDASNFPIRAAKFIANKHWIVCGADDMQLRVFNYNTMEKVKSIEAHADFIRCIIVHPTEPYVVSCSDDTKIKIWNYEKDFVLVGTLEEHKHFVLALAFNPKDLTKFASVSMDKSIKIWNLTTQGKANITLGGTNGHKSSVNCIDFYKGDKPHFATGSDDKTIKIWDYQTKQCLATLEAHSQPVTSLVFHPQLPILISNCEDAKTLIHHSGSHAILNALEYNLGMGWAVGISNQDSNILAFGYDEGSVIIKIGSDDPIVSISNGKILWTKSMEVYGANLKAVDFQGQTSGQKVKLASKELGSTDIYPTYIRHSPNGHHFALCNRKEFIVVKTASFKTVVAGNGTNLIWHNDSDFAVLDNDVVNMYHNFESDESIKISFPPLRIFQGTLIGLADQQSTNLYEWSNLNIPVHRLELSAQKIWWDVSGECLAICSSSKLMLYSYNSKNKHLTELLCVQDSINSGVFVDKIFYYMTKAGKIHFSFSGKSFFYAHAVRKQFILGAVQQQQRLYLFDKTTTVFSHYVPFGVFQQMAQFIDGKSPQPQVEQNLHDCVSKCYHAFDMRKEAYKLAESQDLRFQLALELGYIREAHKIAINTHSNPKLKTIGDLSLRKGQVELAIECYKQIDDLNALLMIYSSLQLPDQLTELAHRAEQLTKMNVAYMCYYLTNEPNKCLNILLKSKRFSQAALFARTYCSARVSQCVKLWKQSLDDKTIALKISDPADDQEEEEQQKEKEVE